MLTAIVVSKAMIEQGFEFDPRENHRVAASLGSPLYAASSTMEMDKTKDTVVFYTPMDLGDYLPPHTIRAWGYIVSDTIFASAFDENVVPEYLLPYVNWDVMEHERMDDFFYSSSEYYGKARSPLERNLMYVDMGYCFGGEWYIHNGNLFCHDLRIFGIPCTEEPIFDEEGNQCSFVRLGLGNFSFTAMVQFRNTRGLWDRQMILPGCTELAEAYAGDIEVTIGELIEAAPGYYAATLRHGLGLHNDFNGPGSEDVVVSCQSNEENSWPTLTISIVD